MLSECKVGTFEKRRKFSIFKSSGRSELTFTGMHSLLLFMRLIIFILLSENVFTDSFEAVRRY